MCGIAGVVGEGLDRGRLLSALQHRGPDHTGEFSTVPSGAGIWLGATRLRISDPTAAADQPMSLDNLVIVFNGEIDNQHELRKQLDGPFRTRSDTEVILHGYRKWGEGVVERLAGMFAFALWDGRRLLLARDRLGIKPLWMTTRPPQAKLAFASEVRALLAAGVPASLDSAQIAAYLATGAVPEPRSLVRGIDAFPPAHLGFYENGELRMKRYWSPPPVRPCSDGEALARVRAPLQEAVRASLLADVPVALLLSGGVDSAVLAALAPENVQAFHLVQSGATSERARQAARKLQLHSIDITTDDARASLEAALAAQDQPSPDGANVYLIARAIRARGIKAAVTGLGGDELFLGYRRHLNLRVPPVPSIVRQIAARALPLTSWRAHKLLDLAAARGPVATYDASRALFPSAAVYALCGGEFHRPDNGDDGEPTRLEMDGYLRNTLLRDGDVQSMAHGVELRVPFLDHRLVEAVLSLPLPLRRRQRKQLPAQAAGVPRALASLPKEGFDLPLERWLPAELLPSASELSRVGLRAEPVAAVSEHFRRHPDRPTANRLWALVALVEWARRHRASL